MKRHEALYPLSHHHHHALVTAQELKKAGTEKSKKSLTELRRDVITFWETDGRDHFRDEEETLLPLYARYANVDQPNIHRMLLDHVEIRSLVQEISGSARVSESQLQEIGKRLEEHVRLEERVIFPMIEEVIPEKYLYEAKGQFHKDSVSGR